MRKIYFFLALLNFVGLGLIISRQNDLIVVFLTATMVLMGTFAAIIVHNNCRKKGATIKFEELPNDTYTFIGPIGNILILRRITNDGNWHWFAITDIPDREIPVGISFKKISSDKIIRL